MVSGQIRSAFEVQDLQKALERTLEYGGNLVHKPVLTPWNDLNARIQSPERLQISFYQVQKES